MQRIFTVLVEKTVWIFS